jgi:hypothetical protein
MRPVRGAPREPGRTRPSRDVVQWVDGAAYRAFRGGWAAGDAGLP